jgi:hypothetical protein
LQAARRSGHQQALRRLSQPRHSRGGRRGLSPRYTVDHTTMRIFGEYRG